MKVVGIIGGGAAGLCALRHFADLAGVTPILWEKSKVVGGTWVYTDQLEKDEHGLPVHSSMYKSLKTNLPKEVMAFPDFPFTVGDASFVHHTQVLSYLQKYAEHFDLATHIKLGHVVEHVAPADESSSTSSWLVTVRDLTTDTVTTTNTCDTLIVCNGHYSVPFIPTIVNIDLFTGLVEHSHRYREPKDYTNRNVLVLGASSSGLDISLELAKVAKKVYLSHNQPVPFPFRLPDNMVQVAGAAKVKEDTEDVLVLKDGQEVTADALLYCTGYHYTFPFLSPPCSVTVEENQVRPLYRHLVHANFHTMAFMGIPSQICPFPLFDAQVRYLVRALLGDIRLPSVTEMHEAIACYTQQRLDAGAPARHLHKMGQLQWEYNSQLAQLADFDKLPPVTEKLYNHVRDNRKADLMGYKKCSYNILDHENFEDVTR